VCFACSASVVVLVDELIEVLVELKVVVDRVVVVMVVEEIDVLRTSLSKLQRRQATRSVHESTESTLRSARTGLRRGGPQIRGA